LSFFSSFSFLLFWSGVQLAIIWLSGGQRVPLIDTPLGRYLLFPFPFGMHHQHLDRSQGGSGTQDVINGLAQICFWIWLGSHGILGTTALGFEAQHSHSLLGS
jgi:hypothetical protein